MHLYTLITVHPNQHTTELDAIQRRAIDDILVHQRNIFLTGSGGVGKSFVTKLLIDLLKAHYECVLSVCLVAMRA